MAGCAASSASAPRRAAPSAAGSGAARLPERCRSRRATADRERRRRPRPPGRGATGSPDRRARRRHVGRSRGEAVHVAGIRERRPSAREPRPPSRPSPDGRGTHTGNSGSSARVQAAFPPRPGPRRTAPAPRMRPGTGRCGLRYPRSRRCVFPSRSDGRCAPRARSACCVPHPLHLHLPPVRLKRVGGPLCAQPEATGFGSRGRAGPSSST